MIKTIGDEVMIVGQDVQALTDWAVGFQHLFRERPEPRIGIHYGAALYRDGDYFGREVNLATRSWRAPAAARCWLPTRSSSAWRRASTWRSKASAK